MKSLIHKPLSLITKTRIRGLDAFNRVASPGLGIKMRVTMLVLQEVTAAILLTHGTSSMPNVMDDLRMKLTDSRPSART